MGDGSLFSSVQSENIVEHSTSRSRRDRKSYASGDHRIFTIFIHEWNVWLRSCSELERNETLNKKSKTITNQQNETNEIHLEDE